jgi:hypothetical protein
MICTFTRRLVTGDSGTVMLPETNLPNSVPRISLRQPEEFHSNLVL